MIWSAFHTKIRRTAQQQGFSLVELLVVIMVIALLASLSVGRFTQYLVQSQREAAITSLYAGQQMMERARLQSGAYQPLTSAQSNALQGQGQNYTISSQLHNGGYVLSATPRTSEPQCGTLTLSHADVRGVTGTASVDECWH